MKKFKMMPPKTIAVLLALFALLGCLAGCGSNESSIVEQSADEAYSYVNPDETKAEPDAGITIDGVLDEKVYQNNNWLYLHNDDGGNNVDIAMTSYYGQKGMYFVYDVTESVPIYVNLDRASYMNSCIEMYFAPSTVTSLGQNSIFEVDLLPTGDMVFKKSDGKGKYVNVATTDDIMAYLGTTTKGGEVNSESCYGYCLELFIPWDYMDWLGMDADAMKQSFVYVDPAHITSNNYTGTDSSIDRYWYFYAQQQGATFSNVFQYFRFDKNGAMGTVPVELDAGKNCTLQSDPNAIPGVLTTITIRPDAGYALKSILVNGEEWIEKANFNEDGSVDLVIRPGEKGLKISAEAEAATEGTKTLSGKVILKNMEADTLEGVLLTYTGPKGEKPVELDKDGNFLLSELEQGYYVLKAEKEGYISVSRGVFLNRDTIAELALEFDMFFTQNGTSFILDGQNEGYVQKFGGTGYIMSNPTYNRFTYEMKIRYDEDLATEADTDAFKQQRTGMRIQFSNGKYWYLDMLKEGDDYILQYAKHSNSIFDKWTTVCKLDQSQIAKYKSEEGISLKVVREGRFAAVYLDGKLLRVEKLDAQYATCSAQLGMQSWSANRGVMEIPYSISRTNAVYVPGSDFYRGGKWDITGQYAGYVTLPGGGDGGWLNFGEKTVNSDITLTIKDNPKIKDKPGDFRTVLKYTFDNEKTASFSVFYNENGQYVIQSMGDTVFGWKTHYILTDEEIAKLTGDGIDLRVVRIGTEISCYLDGKEIVSGADLTKAKDGTQTGIKANMQASVAIRHYGDAGATFVLPYEKDDTQQYVKILCEESENGTVVTNKQNYLLGDTVILSGEGAQGWYCVGMTLDGQEVTLNWDGTYSFETTKTEYTVKGTFDKAVFAPNKNWGLLKQNQGVVSLPEGGDGGWLDMLNTYQDIDLTLNVRDYIGNKTELRQVVKFTFDNGQTLALSVTYADGEYKIQSMNDTLYGWAKHYTLSSEQIASYQDQDGLAFRLVRIGEEVSVYLDGEEVLSGLDLTVNKKGEATGIKADDPATVSIRHYGNQDVQVEIPFSVTDQIDTVTILCPEDEQGTVTTAKKSYLAGDRVVLTPAPKAGYYCIGMTVDGQSISANEDGTYAFVATKAEHTVRGIFYKLIFKDDNVNWNVYQQHEGVLKTKVTGNTGYVSTVDNYNQFTIGIHDPDGSIDGYSVAGQFVFENGKIVNVQVTKWKDNYYIKSANSSSVFGGNREYLKITADNPLHAAIRGDGIKLTAMRVGTQLILAADDGQNLQRLTGLWRDGDSLDLTKDLDGNATGITETMYAKVELCSWCKAKITLPFELKAEPETVNVRISAMTNGKVTTNGQVYLIGDTVTLTVSPDSGYVYNSLMVDGNSLKVDWKSGTCSFVAGKNEHIVTGSFVKSIFKDNAEWDVSCQNDGYLVVPSSDGDAASLLTVSNTFKEVDFRATIRDQKNSDDNFRFVVYLDFGGDKWQGFSLTNDESNNDPTTEYELQTLSGGSLLGWTLVEDWKLSDALVTKIQNEGVEFRLVRVAQYVDIYIDGQHIYEYDLTKDKNGNDTNITADTGCDVQIRYVGNKGLDIVLPFSLRDSVDTVKLAIADTENGTVTADQGTYLPGDTVTLNVTADSSYAHNLKLNGSSILLDWDSDTYSFVAKEGTEYSVTGSFDKSKWVDGNGVIYKNEHVGVLGFNYATGNSGWIKNTGNYTRIRMVVKDYVGLENSGASGKEFSFCGQFTFKDGTNAGARIINENGAYKIGLIWSPFVYEITDAALIEKIQTTGAVFELVLNGDQCEVWLEGTKVYSYTCNYNLSSNPVTYVRFRSYGNYASEAYDVELPYELS